MDNNSKKEVSSFIQEKNGKFSSSRLLLLVWGVGVLIVWGYSTFKNGGSLQAIPESVVTVVGIFAGSKVIQRFGESE